jgi:hypothetical protein
MNKNKELALLATNLTAWRWVDGMVPIKDHAGFLSKRLPDFSHPATMGCLLLIVRGIHGPTVSSIYDKAEARWEVGTWDKNMFLAIGPGGATEAEALISALEAKAPKREIAR